MSARSQAAPEIRLEVLNVPEDGLVELAAQRQACAAGDHQPCFQSRENSRVWRCACMGWEFTQELDA